MTSAFSLEKPPVPAQPLDIKDKIRLDRYAIKGNRNDLKTGDWCVVLTVEHPKFPVKEIGIVRGFLDERSAVGLFDPDQHVLPCALSSEQGENRFVALELISGGDFKKWFIQYVGKVDKLLEYTWGQICHRVALGVASVEKDEATRERVYRDNYEILINEELIPAGRANTGAGTKEYKQDIGATPDQLTLFNCYVIPNAHDSRQGLIESLGIQVEIHSRGGGVGQNWSSARPRTTPVMGVRGRSSGAVSWGGGKSYYTGLIEQGGSRRGATMGMLCDWHPDLIEFITCKLSQKTRRLPDGTIGSPFQYIKNKFEHKFPGSTIYAHGVENANLSVLVSEAFMKAVENDEMWKLVFPDVRHPNYNEDWDGDLPTWIAKHGEESLVVYHTYRARDIYDLIVECNWMSAEPGVVFLEYYRYMSNSNYYRRGRIDATNPCGEQGLPAWGVCNLSAINLSRFVNDEVTGDWKKDVKWNRLAYVIRRAVRFLDNVIDHTPYFFKENEIQQKGERRIGLGEMGLAEMLIRLGLRYGSPEAIEFTDHLHRFMAGVGYHASVDLAAEKGPFPWFDAEGFLSSGHMRENILPAFPELEERIRKYGIRNVTIFTIAPTGSTGTMTGTSTGCEPYFMFSYWRNSRLGMSQIVEPIAIRWFEQNGINPYNEDGSIKDGIFKMLPDYYVTAMDLTPEEHIRMQAAMQKWICSSIAKTINAPNSHTLDDIREMIMLAWKLRLKGFTYYRDGSRDEQVLTSDGATSNLTEKPLVEGLDKLSSEQLAIVQEYVRSCLATDKPDDKQSGMSTEEEMLALSGCIGGKCTLD